RDYCKSLGSGYRLPDVNEFSNTNPDDGWIGGYVNRYGMYARRQLSYQDNGKWIGGIANEWGCMSMYENSRNSFCQSYIDTDWNAYYYWTNNVATNTELPENEGKPFLYWVEGRTRVLHLNAFEIRAACVTP
ncbi:hypothetical protein, partial [uncultured Gilliamella sp.]